MINQNVATTKDRLVNDLRTVVADSESLLKELAGELSEQGKLARERLHGSLERARASCSELQEKAKAGVSAGVSATDRKVRENPYGSLGIAFGVGVLLGVLMFRD